MSKKKQLLFAALMAAVMFVLAGCAGLNNKVDNPEEATAHCREAGMMLGNWNEDTKKFTCKGVETDGDKPETDDEDADTDDSASDNDEEAEEAAVLDLEETEPEVEEPDETNADEAEESEDEVVGEDDGLNDNPRVFTQAVCEGNAALVYQSADEKGDGVTLSTVDEWECENVPEALLVVEPWSREDLNPDRACIARDWAEVRDFTSQTGWENGSVWLVGQDILAMPMIVRCADVQSDDDLGINPWESQLDALTLPETIARLEELTDMSVSEAIAKWADLPLFAQLKALGY
jgi:hypothetical protein